MRRWQHKKSLVDRAASFAGMLALAGAGVLLVTQYEALRRYLGIRRMSAPRHPEPPGIQPAADETPPRWGTTHWPLH